MIRDDGSIEDQSPVCTWESNAINEFVSRDPVDSNKRLNSAFLELEKILNPWE